MKNRALAFMSFRLILGKLGQKNDLAKKAVRGAITSVAISIIPLVIVLHIANGMLFGIIQRLLELDSYHIQIQPVASKEFDNESLVMLRSLPHIAYAYPEKRSFGMLAANSSYEGVAIRAVPNEFFSEKNTARFLKSSTEPVQFGSQKDIILGEAVASKLHCKPGDAVMLITAMQSEYASFIPRFSIFIVKSIVSSGYQPLDSQWVFISETSAKRVFSESSTQSFIGIKTDIPSGNLEPVINEISEKVPGSYRIYDWHQLNKTMNDSLQSTRTMLLVIMSITVVVAAVNILSSLRMMILEKSPEFAILQCIGTKPKDFIFVVCFSGALIGLSGALLGMIPAIIVSKYINEVFAFFGFLINAGRQLISRAPGTGRALLDPAYYLDTIPIVINFKDIGVIILSTTVLSGIIAMFSVREILRRKPIETIRQH